MRRVRVLVVSLLVFVLAVFGLAACGGSGGSSGSSSAKAEPANAADVFKAYSAGNADNYTVNGAMAYKINASGSGMTLEMPINIKWDNFDFAGKYSHGKLSMSMEAMGQSENMNAEMYMDLSGSKPVVYSSEDGTTWTKNADSSMGDVQQFLPTFADSTSAELFAKSEFSKTDSGYTVKVKMKDWMDNTSTKEMFSQLSSAMGQSADTEALEKAMEGCSVTYTFDKDCNLTKLQMDEFTYETTVNTAGTSMNMKIGMSIDCDYSNFGKIDESKVKAPESVVSAAK